MITERLITPTSRPSSGSVPDPGTPDDDTLLRSLSMLGPSASSRARGCVFRKLTLLGAGLRDMSFVTRFPCLEFLDLSGNFISRADSLTALQYLVDIDLSNNRLVSFSMQDVPVNLQVLDLSRNQLMDIAELSRHPYLRHVCLDRNLIKSLDGLQNCHFLVHLSISHNAITSLRGLEGLPLQFLDVRQNRLRSLEGTAHLATLTSLLASHNDLTSLPATLSPACALLATLYLDHNMLSSELDLAHLQQFPRLRNLTLSGNPWSRRSANATPVTPINGVPSAADAPAYALASRRRALYLLPHLEALDGLPTGVSEKIAAINTYDPPGEVVTAVAHAVAVAREAGLVAPQLVPEWGRMMEVKAEDDDDYDCEGRHESQSPTARVGRISEPLSGSPKNPTDSQIALQELTDETPIAQRAKSVPDNSLYFSASGLGSRPCPFAPLVLVGPAGAGKRTLLRRLVTEFPHIFGTIPSHTTRTPRAGERHGVDYYFVSSTEMDDLVRSGKMLSVVALFGHRYGTSTLAADRVRNEGKIGVMAVEMAGATALTRARFHGRLVAVAPPSEAERER
ncbi:hypothetical protein BC828DRAFT_438431, partial [Blastocladiella britannica]